LKGKFKVDVACKLLEVTRQAYYKDRVEKPDEATLLATLMPTVKQVRQSSPTKGVRAIYEKYGHTWPIGRDKSESLLLEAGFGVCYPKHYRRATQAGCRRFGNLLVNKEVTGINQVWQSDMAYYVYRRKHFYTLYITDVYSQEIVGYGAYQTNHAVNYAQVLSRAIQSRSADLSQLIHHSDGGKQYESAVYMAVCKKHKIRQSMCMYSYENPYAEKTNDLINNGYLNIWKPDSLHQLRIMQTKAIKDHNENSQKKRLGKRSPHEFKQWLTDPNNRETYRLQLKPANPEQPKNKQLSLPNFNKTE
jgi:putative transposase